MGRQYPRGKAIRDGVKSGQIEIQGRGRVTLESCGLGSIGFIGFIGFMGFIGFIGFIGFMGFIGFIEFWGLKGL